MKNTLKKIASIIIFTFSFAIFTPNYSFADHRFNRGTTERWGRGGKWETKDSSASNTLWPIVIGALGIGVLIYLFKNGPSFKQQEPQKIIIINQEKPKNDSNKNQRYEYENELQYNKPEESRLLRAADSVIIIEDESEYDNSEELNKYDENNDDDTIIVEEEF